MGSEKLYLNYVGRGFAVCSIRKGMPTMRRLATTYMDQFNRTLIKVDDQIELLTHKHRYLPVD